MRKTLCSLLCATLGILSATADDGRWPSDYEGVMLQGFYWDSYKETSWSALTSQVDELAQSFSLIWLPQSGYCNTAGNLMGYTPVYYFTQHSSFGSEQQLRHLINLFRQRGTGVIADVVVNHRNNMGVNGSHVDFPAETYQGETYQMTSSDICRNDDGGETKKWATANGISLSTHDDTGEDWPGCRDLDHRSANVQRCVTAYLDFLLHDMGFSGFRYDMVRGFSASYVEQYNAAVQPPFSVGEHWSSSYDIGQWIKGTSQGSQPQSAAFDFQFRYRVRDAINNQDWRNLGYDERPLALQPDMRRYAVTFVENHDMERRSNDEQDPILRDTLAANAYLLAMPGTPCVFWRHWADCKEALKPMIEARRQAGITNTSTFEQVASTQSYHAVSVKGRNATLLCVVGSKPESYRPSSAQYTLILEGRGYRYYLARTANTVWADRPSGRYTAPIAVTLTAVGRTSTAPIVYTTDGTTPTADSPQVANGTTLQLDGDCTLTMGLLVNGEVTGITTRRYEIRPFASYKATIYVQLPSGWSGLNIYAWDQNNKELSGSWPGTSVTTRKRIDGSYWYYKAYTIKTAESFFSLVLNSNGQRQSIDITGINADRYFVVTTPDFGGKYVVEDVTDQMVTAIDAPQADIPAPSSDAIYDLAGRPIPTPRPSRIYIQNGKKIVPPLR